MFQSKIEKRLKMVESKLTSHQPDQDTEAADVRTQTIAEKFPYYVRHDGRLYSNQLIDMLRAEEKSKKKVQPIVVNSIQIYARSLSKNKVSI